MVNLSKLLTRQFGPISKSIYKSVDFIKKKTVKDRIDSIEASGFFDTNWYLEKIGLSGNSAETAIRHYIEFGSKNKRLPHPLFDADNYLVMYPDAEFTGVTLLEHFIIAGNDVSMSPLFDPFWYRKQAGDLGEQHPMLHFLRHGAAQGLSPHPLFDSKHYFEQAPQLALGGTNPLTHFIEHGACNGLNPNRFFDASWYTATYSDITTNPLVHFITAGANQGNQPHPGLDLTLFASARNLKPLDAFFEIVRDDVESAIDRSVSDARAISAGGGDQVWDLPRLVATPRHDIVRGQTGSKSVVERLPEFDQEVQVTINTDNVDVVSFDVWDTLLRRDCHPDEIKVRSARWLLLNGHDVIRPAFRTVRALFAARRNAENASAPNHESEYRFEFAIDGWLDAVLVRGTPAAEHAVLRDGLVQHEHAAELSSTRPDLPMFRAVEALRVPAVFASDFYMSAEFIGSLLRHHGFGDRIVTGFASSDRFETKRSGQMFDRLVRDLGTTPNRILHVGDNPHADDAIPRSRGIQSLHYLSKTEGVRHAYFSAAFEEWCAGDGTRHSDRIAALCNNIAATRDGEGRTLRGIGARLAPVVVGYALNIVQSAILDGVDTVFFFTREGLFLRQVYDAVVAADPFDARYPASELLEVSRRSTFAASLDGIGVPQLMRLWTLYSRQSMKGLASSLNLDLVLMRSLCEQFDIDLVEPIEYPWLDKRVLGLLENEAFRAHAEKCCAEQRQLLTQYLVGKGFLGRGLHHIVDVGWRGTIQDNIARLGQDIFIRGHYLGLFRFLNEQPDGIDKIGWLFNENAGEVPVCGDVAALEMLTNAPGGSVTGYRTDGDVVVAVKEIIRSEEAVIRGPVAEIQAGMLDAVDSVIRYVRLHGLVASDMVGLARELVVSLNRHPPSELADAFNQLEHNETFGTGETQTLGGHGTLTAALDGLSSAELNHKTRERLAVSRWPEAQLFATDTVAWWADAPDTVRRALPLAFLPLAAPSLLQVVGTRLSVYAPSPILASGGHRTIYNIVRRLAQFGFNPEIFLEGVGSGIECVEDYLKGTPAIIHTHWHSHIPAEAALATIAHSSQYIGEVDAKHKAYLVQDFEASFNPMSDAYLLGENSYAQGHHHFTIGNWLSHVINLDYGAAATPAGLGTDTDVYRLRSDVKREQALCFLYQPDKPRRAPLLGITALRLLKRRMPAVKIYVYGSDLPLRLDFPVENLGLIHDLSELNSLYARCKIGLCISGSNPSRIPYEMMGAGCVPVDLYRYNNLMDHQAGTISLAYQDAASLAEAMYRILADETVFEEMSKAGNLFVRPRTLDWEADVIANSFRAMIEGTLPTYADVKLVYDDPPIIAESSRNAMVKQFCDTQRDRGQRRRAHESLTSVRPAPLARKRARSTEFACATSARSDGAATL